MGALMPQGPNRHCGDLEVHVPHPNPNDAEDTAWCDGVEPLEPFVELTIRVPLTRNGLAHTSNAAAVRFMERAGLEMFVNYMDHPATMLVMRARTEDGIDKVYPIVRSRDGKGFKAVVMPDGE